MPLLSSHRLKIEYSVLSQLLFKIKAKADYMRMWHLTFFKYTIKITWLVKICLTHIDLYRPLSIKTSRNNIVTG